MTTVEITLLIALIISFFAILLQFYIYHRGATGHIVITEEDGKQTFSLELDEVPEELEKHDKVIFKIVKK